jgi:hypothetical protein
MVDIKVNCDGCGKSIKVIRKVKPQESSSAEPKEGIPQELECPQCGWKRTVIGEGANLNQKCYKCGELLVETNPMSAEKFLDKLKADILEAAIEYSQSGDPTLARVAGGKMVIEVALVVANQRYDSIDKAPAQERVTLARKELKMLKKMASEGRVKAVEKKREIVIKNVFGAVFVLSFGAMIITSILAREKLIDPWISLYCWIGFIVVWVICWIILKLWPEEPRF